LNHLASNPKNAETLSLCVFWDPLWIMSIVNSTFQLSLYNLQEGKDFLFFSLISSLIIQHEQKHRIAKISFRQVDQKRDLWRKILLEVFGMKVLFLNFVPLGMKKTP